MLAARRAGRRALGQNLQSHIAMQDFIVRAVNHTHSSFSQLGEDVVVAQNLANQRRAPPGSLAHNMSALTMCSKRVTTCWPEIRPDVSVTQQAGPRFVYSLILAMWTSKPVPGIRDVRMNALKSRPTSSVCR